MTTVLWILVGLFGWLILYKVTEQIDNAIQRKLYHRREERFLRFVRIVLPDVKIVECISVATSDKQAMDNLERRIRDASRTL
jgi:hypothetical protein